ncbi:hypothetical protein AC369_22140 [Salmonella enterica subsp. diarizonae]|nr:hypothetical protein [Salmonella enterica subsp. diarizonae]
MGTSNNERNWTCCRVANNAHRAGTKKPAKVIFHVAREPRLLCVSFGSPHRLIGVLLRQLNSCCC